MTSFTQYTQMPQMGDVSITVDIPRDLFDSRKFRRRLPAMVRKIAREGKRFWENQANQRLGTSREMYLEGIKLDDQSDNGSFVLSLEGFIPMMIEGGVDKFDMKPGFLNSPKAKTGPMKRRIPRAKADLIQNKPGGSGATRYMIVPFTNNNPIEFRTVTDKSPQDTWWWKPRKMGLKIAPDVADEIEYFIVPKHVNQLLDDCL